MPINEAYTGTHAIDTTEWSCTGDTGSVGAITTDGIYQVFLDLDDMVAGDQLQVRIYEKCRTGDTQRIVFEAILVGDQGGAIWASPSLILMNGWDVTLDALVGTITVLWSIRQVA